MKFVKSAAAGEELGIKPTILCLMAARGEIPAAKAGRAWVFDVELVRSTMAERMKENVREPAEKLNITVGRPNKPNYKRLGADENSVTEMKAMFG